jgi:hypothetical protein
MHRVLFLLLAAWSGPSAAATIEQIVGGLEAMIVACGPVDPKSAKAGAEMLERERVQNKLDLAAIRTTEGYKSVYNPEVNRLLAMPPKARQAACQSVL